MSLWLLDTNIWIALARAEPGPLARLRSLDPVQVATCSVVRAELMFGARKSRRVAENLEGFRRLLEPFSLCPSTRAQPDTTASFGPCWSVPERRWEPTTF